MNKLVCPNCYSTSSVHHHTDWKHIDNHTGTEIIKERVMNIDKHY